jgi:hypothetical protein
MRLESSCWVLAMAMGLTIVARAESPVTEVRSTLEKWVETRQLISRTKSDWQSDKEMLEQTCQLLERELKELGEQSAKLSTNHLQVEKERAQAEATLASSEETLDQARQFAADFEAQVRIVVPQFPGPLQELLRPLLDRLPSDPASTKMAPTERMQVIVGILSELDKFNSAVSVFSEKRRDPKGEELAVETVYVGLGAAYFVSDSGKFAGTGMPGPNGWEWTSAPEIGPLVKEVVRIYRNERPARFVSLPAVIR